MFWRIFVIHRGVYCGCRRADDCFFRPSGDVLECVYWSSGRILGGGLVLRRSWVDLVHFIGPFEMFRGNFVDHRGVFAVVGSIA